MSSKSAPQNGFTLVELLLVISIMVILTGAMIPSFSSYLSNQSLKQAQERLKSDIRSIQNKALTGALYDQTLDVGGTAYPVTHWGIRFNAGTTNYSYFLAAITGTPAPAFPATRFSRECASFGSVAQGVGSIARFQGRANLPNGMQFKGAVSGCLFFSFKNGTAAPSATNNGGALNGTTSPIYFGFDTSDAAGNCRNVRFNTDGLIFNSNNANCTCNDYSTANNPTNCP